VYTKNCEKHTTKSLLSSIIISSMIPLYGSSMIWVQLHMLPQLSDLWVSLQIVLGGISLNCESSGDDGSWNVISLTTAAICTSLGATIVINKCTTL